MKAICNIDTLEAGIEIKDWQIDNDFILKLEELKQKMQQDDIEIMPIKINNIIFNLQSYGVRFYPYVLINEDCFNIYIARKPMNNNLPIRVSLRSMFLWEHGYWKAWEIIKDTIAALNYEYTGSKLSRVDLACHVQGLCLTEIFQRTQDFIKIRTRAKKRCRPEYDLSQFPNIEMTSLVVGSGDNIMLRIYDKVKEMSDKRALVKEKFFKEIIWPNAGIDIKDGTVFNVEFQLRREAFKTFHFINGQELSSVENLFFSINDIWSYLANEWFSLVDPCSDTNRTRQIIIPEWDYIAKQKFDIEENGFTYLQRMYHKSIKQEAALRGVAAYATSYAALCYERDYKSVADGIFNRLSFMIANGMYEWDKKVIEKLNKLPSIKGIQQLEEIAI